MIVSQLTILNWKYFIEKLFLHYGSESNRMNDNVNTLDMMQKLDKKIYIILHKLDNFFLYTRQTGQCATCTICLFLVTRCGCDTFRCELILQWWRGSCLVFWRILSCIWGFSGLWLRSEFNPRFGPVLCMNSHLMWTVEY